MIEDILTKQYGKTWELAEWVKHMSRKYEGLSLNEEWGMFAQSIIQVIPWHDGRQSQKNSEAHGPSILTHTEKNKRTLSPIRWTALPSDHLTQAIPRTYLHSHLCHEYTHIHIHATCISKLTWMPHT